VVTAVDLGERLQLLRTVVAQVPDPELPMLTLDDLGVLRGVELRSDGRLTVTLTPTYLGCPALEAMAADCLRVLAEAGCPDAEVLTALSPAWSSDWISEAGRRKLAENGIAPPAPAGDGPVELVLSVRCPQCGSPDTRELSRFGSTACKSLWVCRACLEPFDAVKVH
jgi:ring-1,2-phenylacetyl-CoA epoxidase subunit PaaD